MEGKLYVFLGDDDYLLNDSARKCISMFVAPENRDFGLEIIDGIVTSGGAVKLCVDNVISSMRTPSFLGDVKVTWLRDAVFLPGGGRVAEYEESKEAVEKLGGALEAGLSPGQVLIVSAPKLRKNSTLYKICAQKGEIEDFGSGLKSWEQEKAAAGRLDRMIEDRGIKMGLAARKEFLQRVGFDTRTIVSELEKIETYACGREEITSADVREIVSIGREAEAWDVLDAFGSRDAVKLVESLERLSGQAGIAIMLSAMIDRTIREMLVLREAYDRRWIVNGSWSSKLPVEADMMLKSLPGNFRSMNGWMLKKKLAHVQNYTQQELRVARYRMIELRERVVSTGQPELFLLQTALLRVTARKEKAARGSHG